MTSSGRWSAALCFIRSLGILHPEDKILPTRREDKPEQLHFLGFNPKWRLLLPALCRVLVNTLLESQARNLRLWSLGQKSHLQKGGVGTTPRAISGTRPVLLQTSCRSKAPLCVLFPLPKNVLACLLKVGLQVRNSLIVFFWRSLFCFHFERCFDG